MAKKYPNMAQGATRNISYNWTKFLRDRGTSITVSSCTIISDPAGLSFSSVTITDDTTTATVTVSGGAREGCYNIKWTATLSNGEIEPKSIPLTVVEHKVG